MVPPVVRWVEQFRFTQWFTPICKLFKEEICRDNGGLVNDFMNRLKTLRIAMAQQVLHTFLVYTIVYVFAFEDLIFVYGQGNQEMIEHGRVQYQLLKEKSNIPKYGTCWKSAVEHLDEGCRYLSEDTQSDIALHITNCFLEMSGHETYNCELDRKPNLRAICINSMSDRAFNVYTEFYTHTQNICWFLRGQIWHETIAENTLKVGKQLEVTAENQQTLLQAQKESLELQEKMLKHGKFLEQVLEDLYISSKAHQEILKVLSQSVANLQAWIVGEVSWLDSIIFYGMTVFVTAILTSPQRTISARFPIFLLLFLNLIIERLICSLVISKSNETSVFNMYNNIYDLVWYSRYGFVFLSVCLLVYHILFHKDITKKNYEMLNTIKEQNNNILDILQGLKGSFKPTKMNLNMVNECLTSKSKQNNTDNEYNESPSYKSSHDSFYVDKFNSYSPNLSTPKSYRESPEGSKENILNNSRNISLPRRKLFPLSELQNGRYNLRSRQGTPDSVNC